MRAGWQPGRRSIFLAFVVTLLLLGVAFYDIDRAAADAVAERYAQESEKMQEQARQLLESKMHTTLALAVTLAQNDALRHSPTHQPFAAEHFDRYLSAMRHTTPFKNVWLEVTGADGSVRYRSWESSDRSATLPPPGCFEPEVFLQANDSDLLISAAAVLGDNNCGGALYVHTHFNSIAKKLAMNGIEAVVMATDAASAAITHPFSDQTCKTNYVANINAKQAFLKLLSKMKLSEFCPKQYRLIDNCYLLTGVVLNDKSKKRLGCMLLFKRINGIAVQDIMFEAQSKKVAAVVMVLLLFAFFGLLIFFYQRRQKAYYKEILDSSSNVIVVTDGVEIIDVNRTFFSYLPSTLSSLERFKAQHGCICDFFMQEDGFLVPEMGDETWVEFVANRPDERHIAKIKVNDEVSYFQIKASRLTQTEARRYSVVFTDITREYLDEQELERISLTDPLTQAWNRRYFDETMQKEFVRGRRYDYPVSLLMIDIDHFKNINDRYGHAMGDKVLIALSDSLKNMLRSQDSFCRIGGEEFAVILPHTDRQSALMIADRIRNKVLNITVNSGVHFSVSIGVCECMKSAQSCYEHADKALYLAKHNGRNRVEQCVQQ